MSLVARAVCGGREFIRQAGLRDAILVVDTDSGEIAAEGRRWGAEVPFLRPAHLARDETSTVESTMHILERFEALRGAIDAIVLLQPTSPLRTAEDVAAGWMMFDLALRPSVVSVAETTRSGGSVVRLRADGTCDGLESRSRGDQQSILVLNGAVYISGVECLREWGQLVVPGVTRVLVMPPERSVDIDTADDLERANASIVAQGTETFAVSSRRLGPGAPCFVIAEAGVNHNGDARLAHRMIDAAALAGVDAIKFQTFDPDRLVAPGAPKAAYQEAEGRGESQHAMLGRLVLSQDAHRELQAHAHHLGLTFLSTPFDEENADFLDALGVPAFKISSGDVTNHPFLAYLARKGKPIFLSTGMSTLSEVAQAVEILREAGNPSVALLHCVSNYPAAPEECNLYAMRTMSKVFGVPVGWSDHTVGISVAIAAVALGAAVIEKHFTLDRTFPGPDHEASLEPDELKALVEAIRTVSRSLGDGVKEPTMAEQAVAIATRRSLHAARDLPAGHRIGAEDVVALRPGGGIPPSRQVEVIGRMLRARVQAGAMITDANLG